MKKIFNISFITFFASIIISIASAYCTVVGMGNIFTSAVLMTMVIAGVIEFGRVVLVYNLHHFWHQMPLIKKLPGIAMLLIAMSLSALGVFGFFSNAYSAKTREVIPIELEIKQLESGIPLIESEISLNNKQIADLQKTMNSDSMDKAIDKYIEKEYVTKALNVKKDMQKQITSLMNDNKTLNEKIITIRVMIMMVFDTLAMYLMITADWIKIITGQYVEPEPIVIKKEIPKKPVEKPVEVIEKPKETKKEKNNIEMKVSKLVKLLREDESIINKSSFIESLRLTPLIVEKLEEELGKDSELMIKIKANLSKKR